MQKQEISGNIHSSYNHNMRETITELDEKTYNTTHNFKYNTPGAPEVNRTVIRETGFTFFRLATETNELKSFLLPLTATNR